MKRKQKKKRELTLYFEDYVQIFFIQTLFTFQVTISQIYIIYKTGTCVQSNIMKIEITLIVTSRHTLV